MLLDEIPRDIITSIALLLPICDIISFGKCSRKLHSDLLTNWYLWKEYRYQKLSRRPNINNNTIRETQEALYSLERIDTRPLRAYDFDNYANKGYELAIQKVLPRFRDNEKMLALMSCTETGDSEIFTLLIQSLSADFTIGRTYLRACLFKSLDKPDIFDALLPHIDEQTLRAQVLCAAAKQGFLHPFCKLFALVPDGTDRNRALDVATENGQHEIIELYRHLAGH